MAPQPPLHPPEAFHCCEGLPPFQPSRFSSNPIFDRDFLKAAFDGDLRLVKSMYRMHAGVFLPSISILWCVSVLFFSADRFVFSDGEEDGQGRGRPPPR